MPQIQEFGHCWKELPLLAHIPVYSFDELLGNLNKFHISFVGVGYHGAVFKIENFLSSGTDATLKMIPTAEVMSAADFQPFIDYLLDICTSRRRHVNLVLSQTAGHVLGNTISPQHIDTPICIWARKEDGEYSALGYSIPFVDGTAVRIGDHDQIAKVADKLEMEHNLYVGSRGEMSNTSCNAILLPNDSFRFIDVRLWDEFDYSLPEHSTNSTIWSKRPNLLYVAGNETWTHDLLPSTSPFFAGILGHR